LTAQGRHEEAEPLVAGAVETVERLAAKPWLERATRLSAAGRENDPVAAGT
jgi:hypothetical protein